MIKRRRLDVDLGVGWVRAAPTHEFELDHASARNPTSCGERKNAGLRAERPRARVSSRRGRANPTYRRADEVIE